MLRVTYAAKGFLESRRYRIDLLITGNLLVKTHIEKINSWKAIPNAEK